MLKNEMVLYSFLYLPILQLKLTTKIKVRWGWDS